MLFLQFLLLLGGSCAIDGYDGAPSCSSFASGSFDIDVIFHVHCTKPVWCVTPHQTERRQYQILDWPPAHCCSETPFQMWLTLITCTHWEEEIEEATFSV